MVRYEELVQRPQETIKRICSWCDIHYDDRLLKPSLLGKGWGGNSVYDNQYTELSTHSLGRWKSEIFDFEIYALNKSLGPVIDEFGYERVPTKMQFYWPLKFFWPMQREPVNTYIKNRYFIKYSNKIF